MSRDPRGVALAVLREITGRRGFRQVWDQVDDGIRDEILSAITAIIDPGHAPPGSGAPPEPEPSIEPRPFPVSFPVRFPDPEGTSWVTEARWEPATVQLPDGTRELAVGLVTYLPRYKRELPCILVLLRDAEAFSESLINAAGAHQLGLPTIPFAGAVRPPAES